MNGIGAAAGQTFGEIDTLVLRDLGTQNTNGTQSAPFYPAGNYVFRYDGTGTFEFLYDCSDIEYCLVVTRSNCNKYPYAKQRRL